jgi:hypothetical protein
MNWYAENQDYDVLAIVSFKVKKFKRLLMCDIKSLSTELSKHF